MITIRELSDPELLLLLRGGIIIKLQLLLLLLQFLLLLLLLLQGYNICHCHRARIDSAAARIRMIRETAGLTD